MTSSNRDTVQARPVFLHQRDFSLGAGGGGVRNDTSRMGSRG